MAPWGMDIEIDRKGERVPAFYRGPEFARQLWHRFGPEEFRAHLVGLGATGDRSEPPELAERLEASLAALGVETWTGRRVTEIRAESDGRFRLWMDIGNPWTADAVVLATGGGRSHAFTWLEEWGHTVRRGGPAFLGLRVQGTKLRPLGGEEWPEAYVRWRPEGAKAVLEATGSLQWRWPFLEGSALARLTAAEDPESWRKGEVRKLEVGVRSEGQKALLREGLHKWAMQAGAREVGEAFPEVFSRAHWGAMLAVARVAPKSPWRTLSRREIQGLAAAAQCFTLKVGKFRQWKDEFSEEGGVDLNGVDPKTMESRLQSGVFLVGELLDLDGAPGGINPHLCAAQAQVVTETLAARWPGAGEASPSPASP